MRLQNLGDAEVTFKDEAGETVKLPSSKLPELPKAWPPVGDAGCGCAPWYPPSLSTADSQSVWYQNVSDCSFTHLQYESLLFVIWLLPLAFGKRLSH